MSRSGSKILHGYYNSMRWWDYPQFVSSQPSSSLPLAVKWLRRVPGNILFTEKTRNDADRGNCYASSKPEHFHENQRCAVTHKVHILASRNLYQCNRMPCLLHLPPRPREGEYVSLQLTSPRPKSNPNPKSVWLWKSSMVTHSIIPNQNSGLVPIDPVGLVFKLSSPSPQPFSPKSPPTPSQPSPIQFQPQ